MADMQAVINTIQNAVYGKEMRPAIIEGLLASMQYSNYVSDEVIKLNKRVDALSGGDSGGGDTPSGMDELAPPILVVNGMATPLEVAGTSTV